MSAPPRTIPRAPRTGDLPLSFAQERLWFLDRLQPGSSVYNVTALSLRLRGPLDEPALARALGEVVRRHEALRTTFPDRDGRPVQRIAPSLPPPLALIDLSGLPAEVRAAEGERRAAELAQAPFDLPRGPLLRAGLFRLGRDERLLLLSLHHIVTDGWSSAVLGNEVAALYAAFAAGRPSPLPELPLQPADAAVWQRRELEEGGLERLLDRWRRRLAGCRTLLELPTDRPRPAVQRFRGARASLGLDAALGGAVRALSLRERVTPYMVLLAAFTALLHRLSGQDDLLVGTPVAGRDRLELEGLIGFFVNTLPLRSEAGDDPPFRDHLARLRGVCLEAFDHQAIPFERLVEELQPARSLAHAPLVQAVFVLQAAGPPALALPGIALEPWEPSGTTAKFDLLLVLAPEAEGLRATLEYDTDLFHPATARKLLERYRLLLETATAEPERRLSGLPLLAAPERHQVLCEWNDTRRPYPAATVHGLFAARAAATPEAPALVWAGGELTYGELARRARGLARLLRARGVGPEAAVGVALERSPEAIVALLAVLLAGGAYVPLDPSWPRERLDLLAEEAGLAFFLTRSDLAEVQELEDGGPPGRHFEQATPESLACVMFTSGSTGRPKGVAVPHRAVVRLVLGSDFADFGPGETWLQLAPLSFDASTLEIWGALLHGGRLVLPPPGPLSLEELEATLARHRVTALWLTAGLFHQAVDAGLSALDGVRQVLAGGDVLSPARVRALLARRSSGRLVDGYGPTEGTTFACCCRLAASDLPEHTVPIGRPIANARVHLLDRRLSPVPAGVPGELWIGGDGLARGYLGRPERTAERFLPDPLGPAGGRLYRTGDLARHLPDGRLEFLGRTDDQVKVRGFRVEPGEIEAALLRHPAVREAAVVVQGEGAEGKRLVAWLVPAGEAGLGLEELRSWLSGRLPAHLVPAAFLRIETLPLTANGKVDRRALASLSGERLEAGAGFVPPRTPAEERLAAIWRDLLGRERIGAHDSFFTLGGDSLLAIQLVSRAGQAGLPLALRQVFQHQTLAEMAAPAGADSGAAGAETGWVTGPVPLTPGQCWFFDRIAGDLSSPHQFTSTRMVEVRAPLPPPLLARAVARLAFHHDALRLRFARRDGAWEQRCAGSEGLDGLFACLDLGPLPETWHREAAARAIGQLLARPELEGPLARFVLFERGPGRPAWLYAGLHHLVSDAASWRILSEDLETVCGQLTRGEEPRLPPKTTSFRWWAEREAGLARSEELRRQVGYWLGLAEAGGHDLPADFPDGRSASGEVDLVRTVLGSAETAALLEELPAATGVPFTHALLAALARAFARWTGKPGLLLRQTDHGRNPEIEGVDLSRTLGWITTTSPVLLRLRGDEKPAEALKEIDEQLRAVPLKGLGYGLLRYMTGDAEVTRRMEEVVASPAATFNFLGRFDERERSAPALFAPIPLPFTPRPPIPRRTPQLRISAQILGAPPVLQVAWDYGTDFYRRETIESLAAACLDELRLLLGALASR